MRALVRESLALKRLGSPSGLFSRPALSLAAFLIVTAFALPAFGGEPWPNNCGSPPDPCCLIPCSSSCSSTAAKCDAGCSSVDPECCDDPCGAACTSTQAKCEAACADVDPECCDDPCGAACSSTQAKCEASCDDVDQACCDDPCGSECSSTSAKCEAGCEGVDQACCDDPCGSECSSTSAKCEAGCEGVDQACCDDPCGSECGSPAAKCEAGCGDVSPECCEDPCGASCTDFDAKCEAECENLPEGCCSEEGTESEEGCECPEPSCSTTLEGDRVCGGESLTLPFSITNTVDPEEECVSTFEWELIQQPPFDGPIFGPRSGSVSLAPGESVDLEELYDLSPEVMPGLAWMQLDVTSDESLVCTAQAEVEVEATEAEGEIALIPSQTLRCPAAPEDFRHGFRVTVSNTGQCEQDFTWTLDKVSGPLVLLDLPATGTTGVLEPGGIYTSPIEDFQVSEASPAGTATLRLTIDDEGRVLDRVTVPFELILPRVEGTTGNTVGCTGQVVELPRSLRSLENCYLVGTLSASQVGGSALTEIIEPSRTVTLGDEGGEFSLPLRVRLLPGSPEGSTATIRHEYTVDNEILWSATSVITTYMPMCEANLGDVNACAGTSFTLSRNLSNPGSCPAELTWRVTDTGAGLPATIQAGGVGSVILQPGGSNNGSVSVAVDADAGGGASVLNLAAYDPSGQLVCEDPGVITVTPGAPWSPWVGTSLEMPDLFTNGINTLLSAIPGVDFEVEASFSFQERVRDCCVAGQQVSLGETEGEGSLEFAVSGEGPVPLLPFVAFEFEVDLGFLEVEVEANVGLFWGFEVGIGGSAGRRINACTGVDCFFGGASVGALLQLAVEISGEACVEVELWFIDEEECVDFTLRPAGISAALEAELGWNGDSCTSGLEIGASLGEIEIFAELELPFVGNLEIRRTVFQGFTLF